MPRKTAIPLTRSRIERLRHDPQGPQQQFLWDAQVPGLGVMIQATGFKSYVVRYRLQGVARRMTIAQVGAISLDAARELARRATEQALAGTDPLKAKRERPERPVTLADLHQRYTATVYFKSRSDDFQRNFQSTMRRYVLPSLGGKALVEINRADVRAIVDRLIDQGKEGMAKGALTHLRVLFGHAIDLELLQFSPADRIKLQLTGTGRREFWLQSAEELRQAWYLPARPQVRAMVRWCLLTGCRRDEARLAHWLQIADEPEIGEVWTVTDTKAGRPLVLPVTKPMREVLDEMRATFPGAPFLFPGLTDNLQPIARGSSDWVLRSSTGDGSNARPGWGWHTLRHTVETHLAELGISAEHRDLVLNHKGRGGVGERYRHGRQLDAKRDALERWHDRIFSLLSASIQSAIQPPDV
ncbi:tyrosine-type recombinase/integrase [Halochromatium roseum]|uniref:tyrosine-type recombinase/integrase n=1 Tax=Halochromatium roseum TaxID=391920 RepID=UPI0019115BAB|nr:integrase family protein [Halochromatium roseum]MBK5939799.1 hypothetical protein [Halochromatium roseum]